MSDKKERSVMNLSDKTLSLLNQLSEKYDLPRQQTLAVLLNKKMKEMK
ncbi:hypothetical protein JRT55_004867 [Escherichia coli]|uniref:Uncharacterized protein n=1 Tax=Klebsiella pneumoniae TaxID=573 RepID=A0AAX2N9C9_KLEPN|nr:MULTISPECIES: hypothetical protein [Klebsiella]EHK0711331.1 hypothetical protein [Escherichia coli]MBG2563354.1 hypothetical protein [Klebsiella oxytoca]EHK3804556.1 hypothetical protein [Escherichia coli]EHS6988227.1 hypothetical protein [Escherichia coli]EIK6955713.1 hypothetical protein [Escherichia coli]